jgi:autoinducer 2-degrading protein
MSGPLFIVHVHARVKPDCIDSFIAATLENARASIEEPGIARFDVVQASDYPTRFILVEVYKSPEAPDLHKRTKHYATWRDRVANMMAEPRSSTKFRNCFPETDGW